MHLECNPDLITCSWAAAELSLKIGGTACAPSCWGGPPAGGCQGYPQAAPERMGSQACWAQLACLASWAERFSVTGSVQTGVLLLCLLLFLGLAWLDLCLAANTQTAQDTVNSCMDHIIKQSVHRLSQSTFSIPSDKTSACRKDLKRHLWIRGLVPFEQMQTPGGGNSQMKACDDHFQSSVGPCHVSDISSNHHRHIP